MNKIQLSIPDPCHENWDNMTPTQGGRFCKACAKQVIDFSKMSDTDVLNYFNIVKNESVCGRAYPDQLNRPIAPPPEKKLFWYWNYLVTFFLFFSKSTGAKAQGRLKLVTAVGLKPIKKIDANNLLQQAASPVGFTIHGSIQDANGNNVSSAGIKLQHAAYGVSADIDGTFTLDIDSLPSRIEIYSVGFDRKQIMVNDLTEMKIVLSKTIQPVERLASANDKNEIKEWLGEVVVVGYTIRKPRIKDTIINRFRDFNPVIKIYPNPISKGNAFTLDLNLKTTGNYTVQITSAAGSLLLERKINALVKKHSEQIVSSIDWSSGIYYLRIIDDKGIKVGTANLAIL